MGCVDRAASMRWFHARQEARVRTTLGNRVPKGQLTACLDCSRRFRSHGQAAGCVAATRDRPPPDLSAALAASLPPPPTSPHLLASPHLAPTDDKKGNADEVESNDCPAKSPQI